MYPGTNDNTNYYSFRLAGYMYKYSLLDEWKYLLVLPSINKLKSETMGERKDCFQKLIDENGWSKSELSRQLNVSTALGVNGV